MLGFCEIKREQSDFLEPGRVRSGLPPRRMGCHPSRRGLDDAGERGEGVGPRLGPGTLGGFAGTAAGRSICSSRLSVVPSLGVPAQHPQQFLVVLVLQGSVS
jgi:hypothetical protein